MILNKLIVGVLFGLATAGVTHAQGLGTRADISKPQGCVIDRTLRDVRAITRHITDLPDEDADVCLSPELVGVTDLENEDLWLGVLDAAAADFSQIGAELGCPLESAACQSLSGLQLRVDQLRADMVRVGRGQSWTVYSGTMQPYFEEDRLSVGDDGYAMSSVDLCALWVPGRRSLPVGLDNACEEKTSEACTGGCSRNLDQLERLLVHANNLDRLVTLGTSPAAERSLAEQQQRAGEWIAYTVGNTADQTQMPWELAANSFIYGTERLDAPEAYVSLLRPQLGLEFYERDGTQATLNAMVELIGYNWIDYGEVKDDGSVERRELYGVGVVAGYGMSDETQSLGYGLQLRNVGRLVNSGADGFLSDLDVAVLYREDEDQVSLVFSQSLNSMFEKRACEYFGQCDD